MSSVQGLNTQQEWASRCDWCKMTVEVSHRPYPSRRDLAMIDPFLLEECFP